MMDDIQKEIKDCNAIQYPSYRTATKVQILHKKLFMEYISLELVIGIFERHKLSITENSVVLDEAEIEDVVSDIYFAAHKAAGKPFDIDAITKLAVNCILSTFNNRGNKVSVFSIKVLLTLISCGSLHEKYEYLYQLLADHNACLSKAALHMMLTNICKVTEFLGENIAYGSHFVQKNIENCFIESQGCLGISKTELRLWLIQDPPILNWISAFSRLKLAENVTHNVKCSSCKTIPIEGLRFSCLKCVRYQLCQNCFFYGKISNKHKLKHPVKEHCIKNLNRQNTKPIVDLIKNKFRLCPSQASQQLESTSSKVPLSKKEDKALDNVSMTSTAIRAKVNSDPQKELSSIINHLEEENKQLQVELREICGSRAERLQKHRATVESQLQRLKILKEYLFNSQRFAFPRSVSRIQSTPMLPALPMSSRFPIIPQFQLSPIVRDNNSYRNIPQNITTNNDNDSSLSTFDSQYETASSRKTQSAYQNAQLSSRIELSTWIGGHRTNIDQDEGNFSNWLNSDSGNAINYSTKSLDSSSYFVDSPIGLPRDNNTPSSLQRPDKHSQHSSLQNIQGDLNDILNRLQHMITNDGLLEESFSANDNCELKRAATEMEDLLTGLIEGMESRKGKLATIV